MNTIPSRYASPAVGFTLSAEGGRAPWLAATQVRLLVEVSCTSTSYLVFRISSPVVGLNGEVDQRRKPHHRERVDEVLGSFLHRLASTARHMKEGS